MKEHPTLFRAEMVRAILANQKSQTRRIIDPENYGAPKGCVRVSPKTIGDDWPLSFNWQSYPADDGLLWTCSLPLTKYTPGDRIWVRETWAPFDFWVDGVERKDPLVVKLRADGKILRRVTSVDAVPPREKIPDPLQPPKAWRPSIFMPRWACRLVLTITELMIHRVNTITEEDASAEGVGGRAEFRALWDSINGKRNGGRFSWAANPWVYAITFRRE